jgi:formate hydrogenlyase subunit 3/multisubunit Na+/H+ antiporter MnhD subunit
MDDPGALRPKKNLLGTIALVTVLLGLLIAVTFFAVRSFTSVEGPPMPRIGYVAMTIGIVLSLLVGIVLMALLFYSSRHGYDERASRETPIDDDHEPQ